MQIYKEWFIKFNFPNENDKPYKINNGKFKETEIGKIPKKWEIDYLGSKKTSKIIKSGINNFKDKKIYLATADVDDDIIINKDTLITKNDKPSRANMQPIENSIWFAKMKDSRKIIMVDKNSYDLINHTIFSTGFCGLECFKNSFYYLYSFILSKKFDTMKNTYCNGTTMQAINTKNIKQIKFVLPTANILNEYNELVKPLFDKINENKKEIEKLTKLRDILLPKLMSGEIDVSSIEI